jgi:hypothetical protein
MVCFDPLQGVKTLRDAGLDAEHHDFGKVFRGPGSPTLPSPLAAAGRSQIPRN